MLAALEFRGARFDWSRVYVAGVLNVTPDSFSDGGRYLQPDAAVAQGLQLVAAGADLIDVGGESTRPGAAPVSAADEIARVIPVIRALADRVSVPISIDTTKAEVARAALDAGAEIVNDISGGRFDPAIVPVAAGAGAAYVLGHARGATIDEVHAAESRSAAYEAVAFELAAGVARLPAALRQRTIVDPGLGFGKRPAQNLELIRFAGELGRGVRCPVMVGPSRKRFIRALVQGARGARGAPSTGELEPPAETVLDSGTVGACLAAVSCGVNLVRVHNVELLTGALMVYEAIVRDSS